jgi:pimeloyl-ACP methyl ester carboxylesterase
MNIMADNLFQPRPFFIEFEEAYLHGDMLFKDNTDDPPNILFLHGARPSEDRSQFFLLRQVLLSRHGLSSCSFDFIGHGSTGNDLHSSSLQQQTRQASDIVDACFDSQPFSIVAVGMGAYTALRLTEAYNVLNLVLLVPAVYYHKVYTVTFGKEFSRLIRTPQSWEKSDAWLIMEDFQGRVSIIAASQDKVIPPQIINKLYEHATRAKQRQVLEISGSSHQVMDYANQEPTVLTKVVGVIADTL